MSNKQYKMKVTNFNIKMFFIWPLAILFFMVIPLKEADSLSENKEIEEAKVYIEARQTINQKPKHQKSRQESLRWSSFIFAFYLQWALDKCPKYILYCNLILYE
ncbi:MAG: hypothetical protein AAF600_14425 [Bacteroidota bacterium]